MSKKRIYFYILFLWLTVAVSPAFIGQKADTTYIFRFALQKDKFYVPLSDNDMKLARLLKCIESNKTDIFVGNYNSLDNERENMRIAAIRANHVKSELIVRGGIKGKCFATENRATEKKRSDKPTGKSVAIQAEQQGNTADTLSKSKSFIVYFILPSVPTSCVGLPLRLILTSMVHQRPVAYRGNTAYSNVEYLICL